MAKKKPKARRDKLVRDRYALYLQSVQAPDVDVLFFRRVFRSTFKAEPRILREDFCGTAAVCCEWVGLSKDKEAYGIDLDPEPLSWGEQHNLSKLNEVDRPRVHLLKGDVRDCKSPQADIVAAQNFSYCIFKERDALRAYFKAAYRQLGSRGVFILDLFGGYESIQDGREDVTGYDGFAYVWEQARFDPITHDGDFYIHFRFPDGKEIRRAFAYHWRLWTIPEVREILAEAGFQRSDVYWEDTDSESGDGSGVYRRRKHGESDPAWNAYIVGVKAT
jgi:SAM-dependent methyltransferase